MANSLNHFVIKTMKKYCPC